MMTEYYILSADLDKLIDALKSSMLPANDGFDSIQLDNVFKNFIKKIRLNVGANRTRQLTMSDIEQKKYFLKQQLLWRGVETGDYKVVEFVLKKYNDFFEENRGIRKIAQTFKSNNPLLGSKIKKASHFLESKNIALRLAIEAKQHKIVQLLLQYQADPNALLEASEHKPFGKNPYRATALHLAAAVGDVALVDALVQAGAQIDAKDKNGCTPVIWAAMYGHAVVIEALANKGADLNIQDERGKTALHYGAQRADWSVVHTLNTLGANLKIRDIEGKQAKFYLPDPKTHQAILKCLKPLPLWQRLQSGLRRVFAMPLPPTAQALSQPLATHPSVLLSTGTLQEQSTDLQHAIADTHPHVPRHSI